MTNVAGCEATTMILKWWKPAPYVLLRVRNRQLKHCKTLGVWL